MSSRPLPPPTLIPVRLPVLVLTGTLLCFCLLVPLSALDPESLTFGVILPRNNTYYWSLPKTRFAVEFALQTIQQRGLLPGWAVQADYRDSKCSETDGPLEAIDMYTQKTAQVFLGPACDYAVAPIARFTKRWEIPVITAGALVKVRVEASCPHLTAEG